MREHGLAFIQNRAIIEYTVFKNTGILVPDRDIQVVGNTLAITEKGSIAICGKVQTTTYAYLPLKYKTVQNIKTVSGIISARAARTIRRTRRTRSEQQSREFD